MRGIGPALALLVLGLALAGSAGAATGGDPAAELARKYAPVVRLVDQLEACGKGEPYEPLDANVVLGNDEVALRGPWSGSNLVKVAPTAGDLSAGLYGYNLDYPGNPLSAGCSYEQWEQRIVGDTQPTTYARVSGDPGYPGQLALQYWFFYVFNDFNNKHEGDWEMIQLNFEAPDAAAALKTSPVEVGYSQHEGAERAQWGDSKLELVGGTHPVVYPADGSHANYYRPALYLGRSGAEGVGCDDTQGPSRQITPKVAFVPTSQTAYLATYPWLGFQGRWGEQQPSFYNGPTGPNTKSQWNEPIAWASSSWRSKSYSVPASTSIGHAATDFFCGAVATGSNLLTRFVNDPLPVLLVLSAFVLVLLWLFTRTRWDVAAPLRLRRRRPWGSLITSAWEMYRRTPRLYLAVGLLFIPLGLVITLVQYLIFRVGGLGPLVDTVGASNAFVAVLAFVLGAVFALLGLTIVQAVTALAMVELDTDRELGALAAYKLVLPRIWVLVRALLRAALVVAVLDLTVIGLPVGIWLTVRWSLLGQVVALEDASVVHPLTASSRLVRRHWLRVASIMLVVAGTGLALGPVIGTLLLLLTSASFDLVNLVAGLVYTITLPFVAVVTTYLYFDLLVEERLAQPAPKRTMVLPAEI